jgi:hypothetical protein
VNEAANIRKQRIWAYAHGEMGEGERNAFQAAMAADPDMRREVEQVLSLHRSLRTLLPAVHRTDEELIDQVMDQFDAVESTAAPMPFPSPASSPAAAARPSRRGLTFRRQALRALLPLAASLALLLALPRFVGTPLAWQATDFVPLQYRGGTALQATEGALNTPAKAAACQKTLEVSVAQNYKRIKASMRASLPRGRTWVIRACVGQLPGRMFSLRVSAKSARLNTAATWSQSYASNEAFQEAVGTLGHDIAEDLVRLEMPAQAPARARAGEKAK